MVNFTIKLCLSAALLPFTVVAQDFTFPACNPLEIIWVRGTHEPQNGSDVIGREIIPKLQAVYPSSTTTFYDLPYAAKGLSQFQGTARLKEVLSYLKHNCSNTENIVLIGFSQGATVVFNGLVGVELTTTVRHPADANKISAVTVFGDPFHTSPSSTYPYEVGSGKNGTGVLGMRQNAQGLNDAPYNGTQTIRSYCLSGDHYCNHQSGQTGPGQHNKEVPTYKHDAIAFIEMKVPPPS